MSDEILDGLVRRGQQAETEAVRLSRIADRTRDDASRRRAGEAWRAFETRWNAVRVRADARDTD
jgi:hypothetical protein